MGGIYYSTKLSQKNTEQRAKAAGEGMPITGTFIMTDMPDGAVEPMFDEMQNAGIDTVVFLASGGIEGPCTPNPPAMIERNYFSLPEPNGYMQFLMAAKNRKMKIFFGLVNGDMYNCYPFWVGNENDTNTYMGKILDYSGRLVDHVRGTVKSQGWDFDSDPQFAGFYVFEGGLGNFFKSDTADLKFFTKLVSRVKTKAPNKKILMSPWVTEQYGFADAKNGYINLYKAGIDIIAPQDSMGTQKVTTFAKSGELFRALYEAKNAVGGGKEAWANIETQFHQTGAPDYGPSNISRVSSQILAAKPYVSKSITWIYQHTMASVPQLDNASWTWTHQYTPTNAAMRKKLRSDYLALYGQKKSMFVCPVGKGACQTTDPIYTETTLCQTNLGIYRPGQTTGVCYETAASCAAACAIPTMVPTATPINGVCSSTHYNCAVGTRGDFMEYNTEWQWWCVGSGGGSKVLCNETKPTQIPTVAPTSIPTVIPTEVINLPTQPIPTSTKKPTATRKPTSPVVNGGGILGDSNDDGVVDVLDYSICYAEMNSQKGSLRCDFTGSAGEPDGVVDTFDYSLWYQKFNESR